MKMGKLAADKRTVFVFLVLVTWSTSVFLLRSYTKGYNFLTAPWYKTTSFTQPPFAVKTRAPEPEVQRCSFKYLPPAHIEEGRRLLDSITWPETLPLPKPFSLNLTTSGPKSTFYIEPEAEGWRVGGELTVRIQMKDFSGNPKSSGGDFLIGRLHNRELGAGVVGQVQDHLNGTFTAVFPLLWNGTASVDVTLVQSSESISVLKRLTEQNPDRIDFGSDFRSGSVKETTTCNVCLDPLKGPLCNYSDPSTGEQWFCYKPKTLDCGKRVNHFIGNIKTIISKEEEALFQTGVNLIASLKAVGSNTVTVLSKAGESQEMSFKPAGYYFNNIWRPLSGPAVRQFNNASAITACLKGKQLHMFGDSTVRQYYSYITQSLKNLQTFDKHSSTQGGPFLAVNQTDDIMVTYRTHGFPIRIRPLLVSQVQYVSSELDRVAGGPNTVVIVGVWAHFGTYPMELYCQRLLNIRRAILHLLIRAPGTKVIIRTGNMKSMNLPISVTNGDWYALQPDKLLRAVFKDTGVFLLESWEMVQAHYLPHNLHPGPEIIKLMMDQVLSLTCPETRR
ncbi:hypothetical protein WMY93_032316 [Mugilogobius chulae]|uniref:NXPE C-terminal domain-containing protein n=1 Tax=Mugilogobius chulae TaxID=88201 RepID=A0AAW0MX61_9GOBI